MAPHIAEFVWCRVDSFGSHRLGDRGEVSSSIDLRDSAWDRLSGIRLCSVEKGMTHYSGGTLAAMVLIETEEEGE
jgi:hypothetical protein